MLRTIFSLLSLFYWCWIAPLLFSRHSIPGCSRGLHRSPAGNTGTQCFKKGSHKNFMVQSFSIFQPCHATAGSGEGLLHNGGGTREQGERGIRGCRGIRGSSDPHLPPPTLSFPNSARTRWASSSDSNPTERSLHEQQNVKLLFSSAQQSCAPHPWLHQWRSSRTLTTSWPSYFLVAADANSHKICAEDPPASHGL